MDIQGILGIDSDVRNGFDGIKVTFDIDADATQEGDRGARRAVAEALGGLRHRHQPDERHRRSRLDGRRHGAERAIEHVTTVVIGAGHAGLAMSRCLAERSIDHVVLERGEVANSWRHERWDSLRLLTPNWQSRLPGYRYEGDDPDGFMTMAEVVEFIVALSPTVVAAPVRTQHDGHRRSRRPTTGYRVATDQRRLALPDASCWRAAPATSPSVPALAEARAGVDRVASRRSTTAIRTSCPRAACWSSARRPPACSSPTRSTARAGR